MTDFGRASSILVLGTKKSQNRKSEMTICSGFFVSIIIPSKKPGATTTFCDTPPGSNTFDF